MKSLRAGANGYLLKDLPTEDLARAIAQVYAGTYQIAPGVIDALLNRVGDGVVGDASHEDTTATGSDQRRDRKGGAPLPGYGQKLRIRDPHRPRTPGPNTSSASCDEVRLGPVREVPEKEGFRAGSKGAFSNWIQPCSA